MNEARIKVAIVGFSNEAKTICEPTEITTQNIEKIKQSVEGYTSSGNTNLYKGLIKAVEKVERMSKGALTHTLILLLGGDASIEESQVKEIHYRLSAVNAQLFAVGIGAQHNKATLRRLAPETGTFKGTYIDTTSRRMLCQQGLATFEKCQQSSFVNEISSIYEQTIAIFTNLELRSYQLGDYEWCVGRENSVQGGNYSVCFLDNIEKNHPLKEIIEIESSRLSSKLDLSKVIFKLVFQDPRRRKGIISIPWKGNTVIDPAILKMRWE